MGIFIALLLIIGAALIVYGILRAVSGGGEKPRDDGGRVEVVYRVPSVFDRRDKK